MTLAISGTKSALAPGLTASFGASGGVGPYVFSVLPTDRGTINPSTGFYTAPSSVANVAPFFDTVTVTDSTGATASATIITGNPWMLLLEIIQRVLNLDPSMIWFENQKFFEPTNALKGMWVVLMFPTLNTFASGLYPAGAPENGGGAGWDQTEKWANFSGSVDINLISRDLSALNLKEQAVMALGGPYSRAQQQANSFYIARLPHSMVDLSTQDGDSIPWRFVISVEIQYGISKKFPTDYFDEFAKPQVVINQ